MKTQKLSTEMFLERPEGEIKVTVEGDYYRGCRGMKAHPMDRFAPPDDPDEITDIEARDESGALVELTEAEEEKAASMSTDEP